MKCSVQLHYVNFSEEREEEIPLSLWKNAEVDTADLQLYETVERMPPFTRKVLVLVGATGLEREALVKKLSTRTRNFLIRSRLVRCYKHKRFDYLIIFLLYSDN